MESKIKNISVKDLYETACLRYVEEFCNKHGFEFEHDFEGWVGNEIGDIAYIGDYYISLQDIMTDINLDTKPDEYWNYYWYCVDIVEFNITCPNYKAWLQGCPRTSKETLERLKSLKTQLIQLTKEESLKNKGNENSSKEIR